VRGRGRPEEEGGRLECCRTSGLIAREVQGGMLGICDTPTHKLCKKRKKRIKEKVFRAAGGWVEESGNVRGNGGRADHKKAKKSGEEKKQKILYEGIKKKKK